MSLLPNTVKPPSDVSQLTPAFFLPTSAALQAKVDASQVPSETACDRVYVLGIVLGMGEVVMADSGREFLLGCGTGHMERLGYRFF